MMQALSKHLFYPLWDLKDRSHRLQEWKQLEEQQWWPQQRVLCEQWKRLQAMLEYASHHSPFYREVFATSGVKPQNVKTEADLQRLPVTTKQDIRNQLDRFISDEYDKSALISAKTGGSTGVSLSLFFDEACQERRNAAQLLADRWSGWDLGIKKAAIWGNPPVPTTLKQKLRHHLLDRVIYLDTMNMNDHSMAEFVERWRAEQPGAVFGHAHSIYLFARYLKKHQITDCRPKGIVATSMMLLNHERTLINEAFGCEVTNRYGCEEVA
ncbi:phenylacetate--CoA ligase family protein [Marinobacter similis]|uniref:Uncharacterized protein n=1 Tax=Marinobacter similis TaxID=1420916 RepID=W5YTY8_9GAMM|nr:hypothetical protein [Marinobacter similis]AHI29908.1 hypothetical protein AU14_01025 [Marinobacter similis]